jgi:hypothetical protein
MLPSPQHSWALCQTSLFTSTQEEFIADMSVSADEMGSWHRKGWLSFDPLTLAQIKQVSVSFLPTRVLSGGKPLFRYDISGPYSTSFGVHLGRTSLLGCALLFTHQGGDPSHQIGSAVPLARHGRDLSPGQACGVTPAQPGTQAQRRGCRASSQEPPATPGVGPPSPGI